MKKGFDIWRLARILVAATLVTTLLACLAVGVYARFFSTASGSDAARVARFDVSAVFMGTDTDFSLSEGADTSTVSYPFSVTSNSEVAVSYDVVLTLPFVLPNGITFTIDGVAPTPNEEGVIYTFSNIGTITAIGGTNFHTLVITATEFSVEKTLDDIKVEIIASQVQPN